MIMTSTSTICNRKRPFQTLRLVEVYWWHLHGVDRRRRRPSSNLPTSFKLYPSNNQVYTRIFKFFTQESSLPRCIVQDHLDNNLIETDLHTKRTDKHQYLLKKIQPSCPHKTHHPFQPDPTSASHLSHRQFLQKILQWTYKLSGTTRIYTAATFLKNKLTGHISSHVKKLWNHNHRTTTQTELPLSSHI